MQAGILHRGARRSCVTRGMNVKGGRFVYGGNKSRTGQAVVPRTVCVSQL